MQIDRHAVGVQRHVLGEALIEAGTNLWQFPTSPVRDQRSIAAVNRPGSTSTSTSANARISGSR